MAYIGLVLLYCTRYFIAVICEIPAVNPIIQYRFSHQSSSTCDWKYTKFSNSLFEFGKIHQNVLDATYKNYDFLHLKCNATYPIRWLTRKPLGSIRHIENNDLEGYNQDELVYVQEISVSLKSEFSRILRCESFLNFTLAAEIFLNYIEGPMGAEALSFLTTGSVFFRVDGFAERLRGNSKGFIVPCEAREFRGRPFMRLFKHHNAYRLTEAVKGKNLTYINVSQEDYDPRIGFRVDGEPDLKANYYCALENWTAVRNIPISINQKTRGRIYYNRANGRQSGIHCKPDGYVPTLRLQIGFCTSIAQCDLKFQPVPPDVDLMAYSPSAVVRDDEEQFVSYDMTKGAKPKFDSGFIHCSTAYHRRGDNPYVYGFVNEMDYMFKGLNRKTHLFKEGYPDASVISLEIVTKQSMIAGAYHIFECKVSTFVLLPRILFEVTYANISTPSEFQLAHVFLPAAGSEKFKLDLEHFAVHLVEDDTDAHVQEWVRDPGKLFRSWRLQLKLADNMTSLTCFAPLFSSSGWVRAEIPLVVLDAATLLNGNPFMSEHTVTKQNIIGTSLTVAVVLAMTVFMCVLWRKYKTSVRITRNLTKSEVEEFFNGDDSPSTELDENGIVNVNSLAFNQSLMIDSNRLRVDEEILGKGEYGIVSKGCLDDYAVAVKKSKPNVDVEYFKSFLKEIKVMNYIGDHENVVKFYGAVVDRIEERICFAVVELSPMGNLLDVLRKYAGRSEGDRKPTVGISNSGTIRYEQLPSVVLNKSVLVSFCKQIANGMEFVSRKKVIHGDLAARNILVFHNNVVKVTDFGMSRRLYDCANYVKTKQALLPWRWSALETLRFFQFSSQSDVWSFGVTVWEIFSFGEVPFSGLAWTPEFATQLECGQRLSKPPYALPEVYNFIKKCWENDPAKRPTFSECKEFFVNLEPSVHRKENVYGTFSEFQQGRYQR